MAFADMTGGRFGDKGGPLPPGVPVMDGHFGGAPSAGNRFADMTGGDPRDKGGPIPRWWPCAG